MVRTIAWAFGIHRFIILGFINFKGPKILELFYITETKTSHCWVLVSFALPIKMPEIINLKSINVYYASQFWRFQCMAGAIALWPLARQYIMVGMIGREICSCFGNQEAKKVKRGDWSPNILFKSISPVT